MREGSEGGKGGREEGGREGRERVRQAGKGGRRERERGTEVFSQYVSVILEDKA